MWPLNQIYCYTKFVDKTRRKLTPIARKRRNFLYFLVAILFLILTGYIFLSFAPDHKFRVLNFEISIIPLFLISIFIFIYSLLRFILIYSHQAFLISIIFIVYLFFRLIGLTHWIFAALLLALFITIELFIIKKK